jgi:hypothetical protein
VIRTPAPDHLRDEVEERNDQRADGSSQLNGLGVEPRVQRISEGVAPEPFHGFGHDEQRHDPAGQVANRVQETVIAGGGDQTANAEEGSRR